MPEQSAPTLVYIMGDGRSGSTILSILLGAQPDIVSVGELHRWPQFEGKPKWNNEKQRDHAFWQAVYEVYVAQAGVPDFEQLVALQNMFERYARFPAVLAGALPQADVAAYTAYFTHLLNAIATVSGKRIILDASKHSGRIYGYWRYQTAGTTVKIIHLVRDPRGVMWSHMKRHGEHKYKPLTVGIGHYMIKNVIGTFVDSITPKQLVMRVRYEDVIQYPQRELGRIGDFLGLSMERVIEHVVQNEPIEVPVLLDGNQIRQKSSIQVRYDDAWRQNLSAADRRRVNILTAPLMTLYGYWRRS